MAKHTIEISDENGKSFRIEFSMGLKMFSAENGIWRSLDRGRIRFNSGKGEIEYPRTELTLGDLYLSPPQGDWGLRLNEYNNMFTGVYEQGTGYLIQPWVLDFQPYRIYWALAD
jgi:hypothetical protein